jgi:activator-of-BECN1-regulated-autophagy protein 1
MELIRKKEGLYGADGNEPPNLQLDCDSHADDPAVCSDDITVCASNTKVAVAAAISRLRGIATEAGPGRGARSPSEGLDHPLPRTPTLPRVSNNLLPVTTENAGSGPGFDFIPRTPPNPVPFDRPGQLSPPSPPGRRFTGGLGQPREAANPVGPVRPPSEARGLSTPPPPPAPSAAPQAPAAGSVRPPHPLSILSRSGLFPDQKGRYVPHVVTISLDTDPIPEEVDATLYRSGKPYGAIAGGYRPRLGQLMEACPLDPSKASAVTCVKFSPSTDYCLIGYGVREPLMEGGGSFHPVTAIFRIRGGMSHVSTLLSGDDDVNIARFHPDSGHGFVYGTKQGRVRILSPRPWNYYNCNG